MEILDQLQEKVRNAVQKIEELQARVTELEGIKRQYEEKMESLVQEFGDVDSNAQPQSDSDSEQTQEPQAQDSLYRHQF